MRIGVRDGTGHRSLIVAMARDGIEQPTRGFSVLETQWIGSVMKLDHRISRNSSYVFIGAIGATAIASAGAWRGSDVAD